METTTIKINPRTLKVFSIKKLENFVNSEDFEDLVLAYQMIKAETGRRQSFSSFKKELGL